MNLTSPSNRHIDQAVVADAMTPFIVSVGRYDSLAVAYERMATNKVRRLPVVEDDELVGLITMSDILRFKPATIGDRYTFRQLAENMDDVIVDLVMAHDLVVVYQAEPLGYAAELMLENKIGGLPVLDASKKLVGILTESDVFRALAQAWRRSAHD